MPGPGDAEHRELSLEERVTRLETAIPFSTLPKRKIKDLIEDQAILNAVTNIDGDSLGDVITEIINETTTGGATDAEGGGTHLRPYPNVATNDFLVPTYPGTGTDSGSTGLSFAGDATISQMIATRCVAARSLTVAKIQVFMHRTAAEGANDSFDAGIYVNDGSSLLGHSGLKLISTDLGVGTAAGYYIATFNMITPFDISAGLVYVFALQSRKGSNSNYSITTNSGNPSNPEDAIVRLNGGTPGTFADDAKYYMCIRLTQGTASGGSPQTVLPATLTTGCNAFYAHTEPIRMIVSE
jgi:hypothetical protein